MQPRGRPQQRPSSPTRLAPEDARAIICEGNVELLDQRAQEVAKSIYGDASTNQVRRLFGEVKRIEMAWTDDASAERAYRRLILLKPRLQYQVARQSKLRTLQEALVPAIDEVQRDRTRFKRFSEFFEAIVAYAKK